MPWIHVVSGPDAGRSVEVADGATLGRDAACTVVLHDASVSRKHARVSLEAGRWLVVDTQSRNGLAFGGQRVERAGLDDRAEFQLGEVRLRFTLGQARAPALPELPGSLETEIVLEGDWSAPATEVRLTPGGGSGPALERAPKPGPTAAPGAAPVPTPCAVPSQPQRAAPAPAAQAPSAAARAPAGSARELERTAARPLPRMSAPLAGGVHVRKVEVGKGGAAATRAVLRYSRFEDRDGFSAAALAQQPWYVKLGVALLGLVLFCVLGWGAFQTASFFKGKTQGVPEDVEEAPDGASDR